MTSNSFELEFATKESGVAYILVVPDENYHDNSITIWDVLNNYDYAHEQFSYSADGTAVSGFLSETDALNAYNKYKYDRCLFPKVKVEAYVKNFFALNNTIAECETSKPTRIPGTNRFTTPPRFLRPRRRYTVYVYIDEALDATTGSPTGDGVLSSQVMALDASNEFVGAKSAIIYETDALQGL